MSKIKNLKQNKKYKTMYQKANIKVRKKIKLNYFNFDKFFIVVIWHSLRQLGYILLC